MGRIYRKVDSYLMKNKFEKIYIILYWSFRIGFVVAMYFFPIATHNLSRMGRLAQIQNVKIREVSGLSLVLKKGVCD
jgi:hypothetical protein